MKTIGLLGGISWVSTALYYKLLNEGANARLGRAHAASMIIKSFDYQELRDIHDDRENELQSRLVTGARQLETAGAELLAIGANTMHMFYDPIQAAIGIPVIHVVDTCGAAIAAAGLTKVGLLGTLITMESDFYRERLMDKFGIETVIPGEEDRQVVERVIREELTRNMVLESSKAEYLGIMGRLKEAGAQGVILGCTEIGLLVNQSAWDQPVFDTTILHAEGLLDAAI